ncbi:MAG: DUF1905 domain-containing protein [Anaerolineae bacterium]|nr:DUF1905 domain-containing protein [Anaerolineae bacterium]
MHLNFNGEVIHWRGPAPYYFVSVPAGESDAIRAIAKLVSYGWGVIPVWAKIGESEWFTSLFPKDGAYLVPIRAVIKQAEALEAGQIVSISLDVGRRKPAA